MTQKGDLQEMGLEKSGSFATKDNGHSSHAPCLLTHSDLARICCAKVKEEMLASYLGHDRLQSTILKIIGKISLLVM